MIVRPRRSRLWRLVGIVVRTMMIRPMRFAMPVWNMPVVLAVVLASFLHLALVTRPFHVFDNFRAIIVVSLLSSMMSRPRTRTIVVLVRGGAFDTMARWLVMHNAVFMVVGFSCSVMLRLVRSLMAGVLSTRYRPRPMTTSIFIAECLTPVHSLMFFHVSTYRK